MYSAEEAAQILGLQVRTVRNYVREGRLPGVRIGKQYRIARADLDVFAAGAAGREQFAGVSPPDEPVVRTEPTAEVSAVVQLDGVGADQRDRLERTLAAAVLASDDGGSRLRAEPLYDGARQRLKVIIVGDVGGAAELLRVIELFAVGRD